METINISVKFCSAINQDPSSQGHIKGHEPKRSIYLDKYVLTYNDKMYTPKDLYDLKPCGNYIYLLLNQLYNPGWILACSTIFFQASLSSIFVFQ
jgi:hypothetical protein